MIQNGTQDLSVGAKILKVSRRKYKRKSMYHGLRQEFLKEDTKPKNNI